ncbi:glucose-1-phosphate cytidylyltransferase [Pelagibacteraceae bacterium]|nr:glucose-1-phosphate cytidylyltransferase [Pelagibacteraceae bacterium]
MKAIILAGGLGTRLSEETTLKPKPMVEIGGKPILWHIMKLYSYYGVNEFVICGGYKVEVIKHYFSNYYLNNSTVSFNLKNNKIVIHSNQSEDWDVTVVDTGNTTMTGGRLKRVSEFIDGDFCFTYGDGVSNINIRELINFHKSSGCLATLTSVVSPEKFGKITIDKNNLVKSFREKPELNTDMINAGYFVLSKEVIKYIDNDATIWEKEPLENITKENSLAAYRHNGFWYPMDKLSDKKYLEELWAKNHAPWKVWE